MVNDQECLLLSAWANAPTPSSSLGGGGAKSLFLKPAGPAKSGFPAWPNTIGLAFGSGGKHQCIGGIGTKRFVKAGATS